MRAPMSTRRTVVVGAVEFSIAGAIGAIIGTIVGLFLEPTLAYLDSRKRTQE